MLKRILPKSAHKYINNQFSFDKKTPRTSSGEEGGEGKEQEDKDKQKSGDTLYQSYTYHKPIDYGKQYLRSQESEEKDDVDLFQAKYTNPVPIQKQFTPKKSPLWTHCNRTEYNYHRLSQVIYHCFNDHKKF
ncbi:hypothetical protein RFI_07751 [Reticulomyxa filosa]|uniref:Uncharacterized protein n=1 Tax=Reticulomyxa filosa TaxID=46433 RepID=X6NSY6_RETFI|nr:hypothetical protein RFI_07751 [Reticulomyxa filosa]|eukprot:ETO29370.1 hypothetical protein RFI_07751 [Reticulomyxa filosa]